MRLWIDYPTIDYINILFLYLLSMQHSQSEGAVDGATQLVFAEPLEEGEDGREEEDEEGEDGEDGASSDDGEKMLIIPGDAVDASAVGTESQIDG